MSVVYVISVDIDWLGSSDGQLGLRGTVVFLHGAPTQSYSYRVVMSQVVILLLPGYPRWQQSVPLNLRLLKKIFMLVNFAYTLLVLNYSCIGFMVLSLHETLTAYGSVYYIGTIIPVVEFLLGNVIKTKLARSNAQKEQ
ncbi:hypothetical protein Tco_1539364 [Tanacetum coccineum]